MMFLFNRFPLPRANTEIALDAMNLSTDYLELASKALEFSRAYFRDSGA